MYYLSVSRPLMELITKDSMIRIKKLKSILGGPLDPEDR